MAERILNILFLCTGNSARSVMAECALGRWGKCRFHAFSAGSHPKGAIHPLTLELLARLNYDTSALRSKSWDEFATPGAAPLDFVFTVCDNAAGEVCPVWPGQPITAHWGVRDPVAFVGSEEEKRRFFYRIYLELENRVKLFASLPFGSLDRMALARHVAEIGKTRLKDGEGGDER
jgi:ArsR family transcriptional regulator, arsenate/arsenite/antimonite-responsive transcriptional repressor / arsenate reductase (thioredoxin)